MKVIDTFLAFFGYIKIPLAAVQLSISQETFIKSMIEVTSKNSNDNSNKLKEYFLSRLDSQKVLTQFLRSGRKLQ